MRSIHKFEKSEVKIYEIDIMDIYYLALFFNGAKPK